MSDFLSSLYGLEIITLSDVGLVKIVSHFVGCSSIDDVLCLTEVFQFYEVPFIVSFGVYVTVFYSGSCLL